MKIVAFEVEPWESEAFEQLADSHEVRTTKAPLTADGLDDYHDAEAVSTFIHSRLDNDLLDRFERLKLIATRSTGFDHIDLDYCNRRGIAVCNVPTYGANTVAEHTFGLLLTISHHLEQAIDRTRKGDFSARGLQGFDLQGKTLGVIGTGDIGRNTIRIARGFGMRVIAFDVQPDEQAAHDLGFEYVGFEDLLERSDVVTLHVPANEKTRHLIGWEQFQRMKDGAVLINTARGQVVDIQALARALAEKKIAAAGLDVLPQEPVIREEAELLRSVFEEKHDLRTLLADQVIVRMRNVVVTPHSAFNTREAVQRILDTTVANIQAFASDEPQNVVNEPQAG